MGYWSECCLAVRPVAQRPAFPHAPDLDGALLGCATVCSERGLAPTLASEHALNVQPLLSVQPYLGYQPHPHAWPPVVSAITSATRLSPNSAPPVPASPQSDRGARLQRRSRRRASRRTSRGIAFS